MAFKRDSIPTNTAAVETPVETPAVEMNTAVTVAQPASAPAVKVPAGGFKMVWGDKQDLFVAEYGELPRLKCSNGNVMDSDGKLLGDWIEIQLLSFNDTYVVSPCDKNAPADIVRYSANGADFADGSGETVADYVAELKAAGWADAVSKKYIEVVGVLRESAKPTDLIGDMVQLQLSPTSATAWSGFRKQLSFKLAMAPNDSGINPDMVRMEVEVVSAKGNTWSKFVPKISQLA
jgi:hypothetical protein